MTQYTWQKNSQIGKNYVSSKEISKIMIIMDEMISELIKITDVQNTLNQVIKVDDLYDKTCFLDFSQQDTTCFLVSE